MFSNCNITNKYNNKLFIHSFIHYSFIHSFMSDPPRIYSCDLWSDLTRQFGFLLIFINELLLVVGPLKSKNNPFVRQGMGACVYSWWECLDFCCGFIYILKGKQLQTYGQNKHKHTHLYTTLSTIRRWTRGGGLFSYFSW